MVYKRRLGSTAKNISIQKITHPTRLRMCGAEIPLVVSLPNHGNSVSLRCGLSGYAWAPATGLLNLFPLSGGKI
jgi:hypothetical protein